MPTLAAAHRQQGEGKNVDELVAGVVPPRFGYLFKHAQNLPGHLGIHAKLLARRYVISHGEARFTSFVTVILSAVLQQDKHADHPPFWLLHCEIGVKSVSSWLWLYL